MSRRSPHAGKAVRNTRPPYGSPVGPTTGQGTTTGAADGLGHPLVAGALARARHRHDPYRTATGGEGLCR